MLHDVVLELELECFNLTHVVNICNTTANKMQKKSENGERMERKPSEICSLQTILLSIISKSCNFFSEAQVYWRTLQFVCILFLS